MYVRRDRLVLPLAQSRVGVVEAASGFGKSVLASQLSEELGVATAHVQLDRADAQPGMLLASVRRALRAARLSDLVAVVGAEAAAVDPVVAVERLLDALSETAMEMLLVFDDAHRLGDEAGALLMRLVRGAAPGLRLLICARRLVGALAEATTADGVWLLDGADLAFTEVEAGLLVERLGGRRIGTRERALLTEATGGWATALVLAARPERVAFAGSRGDGRGELIAGPLRRILDSLSSGDRELLTVLAHLPLIAPELCETLARDERAFGRLVEVGVPLARADSGWWELPGPVADWLRARGPLPSRPAEVAGDLYARSGELLAGIRVLLGVGLDVEAAALLERSGSRGMDELGFAAMRELVEGLSEAAVAAHPRVLLGLARMAEATHQAGARTGVLARVSRILASGIGEPEVGVRLELDAELARDLMWDGRTRVEAKALAASVLERAGEEQLVARARALDVVGRIGAWWSETGPQPEAEQLLEESARLARRLGQRTWAAQALVPLAVGVLFGTCRYGLAVQALDAALAELSARDPYRVNVLSFRAEALGELGRFAEAEGCVAEMRSIAGLLGEPWMHAYASWNEADLASRQGDARRVVRALLEAEQHRDSWFEQPSGVEFLAQAGDYLDRAGEHALARRYVDRARERIAGNERVVEICDAFVLGRSGNPEQGRRAIEAVLERYAADPHERWSLLVLRATAAMRGGDADAGALAAEVFELCLELGHPEGPLLRERAGCERLLPLAAAAGSGAAASLLDRGGTTRIRLLGGFEVSRAGRPVVLPPGLPGKAVRVLAAGGGRLHAEELTELLWPGVTRDAGRIRLRNVLSRLRATGGELLVRDGDSIALAAGCEVDAQLFEADARAALATRTAGDSARAELLARPALERYRGVLLPDDRYEDWATAPRERLRLVHLELLDLLTAGAECRGETDEATRLLERALEHEPYDEPRYLRLARLLALQGRSGSAQAVLRRAQATLAEIGIAPSAELEQLGRALRPGEDG